MWNTDLQGSETIPYDTVTVNTFVKATNVYVKFINVLTQRANLNVNYGLQLI